MNDRTPNARFGPDLSDADKAQLLDEIAEHFPLCINVQDPVHGKFVYVSAAWEQMTGLPVERWLEDPMAWVEMIHPEDRGYTLDLADDGHSRARAARDLRILHQDGTVHWIQGWLAPMTDESGAPVRIIGISEDITERKAVEAELRQRQLELELELRKCNIELARKTEALSRALVESGRSLEVAERGQAAYRELTPREKEVFGLLVTGAPNKEIATTLSIALATVKVHRGRIMTKFEATSFADLIATAVRSGLLGTDATTS